MIDDLRFAFRRLRHAPEFTAVAVLTLALAIGVNTAIFSIADAVMFRPLPYRNPDSVFILQNMSRSTGIRATLMSYEYLRGINDHHDGVGEVGLLGDGPRLLVETPAGAEGVPTIAVSPNYFEILGVRAARGRTLDRRDAAQTGRPAMLSHATWLQRYGADEQIVGRTLEIGGTTFDIVGVLPRGFVFPSLFARRAQVITVREPVAAGGSGGTFHPIVRLEPGVTRAQAQAEMDELIRPFAERDPRTADSTVILDDVRSVLYPVGRPIMKFLLAASMLVLFIGCVNLANMLLVRMARHARESGVRAALGATGLRLVRPIVFESLIIGVAGAALAVLAAAATFDLLLRQVPPMAYRGAPVGVDIRVALMAVAMGIVGGFAFAVVPAWRAARLDVQVLLQARTTASRRRPGWFRHPLIAIQVGLAIALVFGAVLASRAFISVLRIPLGFAPERVLTLSAWPSDKGPDLQAFYVAALEAVARRDGVEASGAAGSMPLDSSAPDEGVYGADGARTAAGIVHMLPGFFETIGMQLLRGRSLSWGDVRSGADVAVVSQAAARSLFPDRDPIGETFGNGRGRRFTVVGVVSDVLKSLDASARAPSPPAYVIPGNSVRRLTIVARVREGAESDGLLADLKREMARLAPRTPVEAAWWSDSVSAVSAYRNPRFQSIVLGTFAVLALGLTVIGVFGIMAFLVASRTREMGIRVAIGANPGSLVTLIVRQALLPVGVGVVSGLIATRWLARLAEAQRFAVDTRDPLTLGVASAVVVVAALLAAYVPARRAAHVDPIVILKAE